MSDSHKAALAEGRQQGRAVRDYLDALQDARPKRGRKRTSESIKKRLEAIDTSIEGANSLTRLKLLSERDRLNQELAAGDTSVDLSGLEEAFVGAARGYGERKGISYSAWRAVGVDAAVLKRAGITRAAR